SDDHWSDELSRTPGGNGNLGLGHFFSYEKSWDAKRGPQCYCHGDRNEDGDATVTSEDKDTWCEWAYAINERTGKMFVYGRKSRQWKLGGAVDLRGEEPSDWEAFSRAIWPDEDDAGEGEQE